MCFEEIISCSGQFMPRSNRNGLLLDEIESPRGDKHKLALIQGDLSDPAITYHSFPRDIYIYIYISVYIHTHIQFCYSVALEFAESAVCRLICRDA